MSTITLTGIIVGAVGGIIGTWIGIRNHQIQRAQEKPYFLKKDVNIKRRRDDHNSYRVTFKFEAITKSLLKLDSIDLALLLFQPSGEISHREGCTLEKPINISEREPEFGNSIYFNLENFKSNNTICCREIMLYFCLKFSHLGKNREEELWFISKEFGDIWWDQGDPKNFQLASKESIKRGRRALRGIRFEPVKKEE